MNAIANVRRLNARDKAAQREGRFMYCGRTCYGWKGSPLGNPYRNGSLEDYEAWLLGRIEAGDKAVLAALAEITPESVLGCWCGEGNGCHCETIWDVWQRLTAATAACDHCKAENAVNMLTMTQFTCKVCRKTSPLET